MSRFTNMIGNSWKVIRVLMSVAVCAVLLVLFVKEFVPRPDTYGSIWVDSPEVYTRERLVNDRFLQDAWLKKQLGEINEFTAASSYYDARSTTSVSPGNSDQDNAAGGPDNSAQSRPAAISTEAAFVDMVDFRDQVRNLKIENQLDDRHDLNGNTLYRLKFDATIIPGASTRALAKIEVKLKGPDCIEKTNDTSSSECRRLALEHLGSNEKIGRLREVYRRWLLNLQARLNQTHREQKQAYYNNEFKKADYTRLKNFFKTYHGIDLTALEDCKFCGGGSNAGVQTGNPDKLNRYSINHSVERACIRSIVRCILKKERDDTLLILKSSQKMDNSPHGEYRADNSSAPEKNTEIAKFGKLNKKQDNFPRGEYPTNNSPDPVTELKISQELEKHLNTFLAGKTLQLVLGIKIPQSEFQQNDLYQLAQLELLSKISFFRSELKTTGYKVFVVTEKTIPITAINPDKITEASFNKLTGNDGHVAFRQKKRDEFQLLSEMATESQQHEANSNLHVLTTDLHWLREESYPVNSCEFLEVESYPGAYVAKAEVGLRNFAKHALGQTKTYVYAVTPKMRSENQFSSFQQTTEAGGGIPLLEDIQVRLGRSAVTRTVNRKGTTVGFGKGGEEKEAVFGWVIGPRLSVVDSNEKVHTPVQQSLSALVSLPSWWNKAQLTVTTNWIGRDGAVKKGQGMSNKYEYHLDLPANYEQLEADMLQLQQLGPELMESMLDPIQLTACKPGAIVIPGRRLWRSTVVTLGYQTADEISVLPNMKGIIARFYKVENQMSVAEGKGFLKDDTSGIEIKRAVRVWTSQGTIALPEPARIGIPDSCRDTSAVETMKKSGG